MVDLILPIAEPWFSKIKRGEKLEEYREIKPYYTARFCNACRVWGEEFFYRARHNSLRQLTIMLRNGYSSKSPYIIVKCNLVIKTGNPEWGATPNKEYYTLCIDNVCE